MTTSTEELVIDQQNFERQYWRDIWHYRELLYFLAWRDVKVRYKQTLVGVLWVVLRPLLMMAILTFVFHRVAGLKSDSDVPYALLVFAALLPWQFFSAAFSDSANSLVLNSHMVAKVYFPRIMIPVSTVLAGLVDFGVSLVLLLPLMWWFGFWPDLRILLLPLFLAWGCIVTLGAGVALSALNVRYRDVRFVVPFVVQFGLYLSPVGFISSAVPASLRWLYDLNPMVGVIDGFRWALLGGDLPLSLYSLASSLVVGTLLAWWGFGYFRRVERSLADVI